MKLSSNLQQFRKTFKITQKQAADAANVSERIYQNYEYGKVIPSIEVIYNLAEHFDVSIDYLVGRTDNPKSHKL
jgi:transcriptional regulator with XRE-family HTH domain